MDNLVKVVNRQKIRLNAEIIGLKAMIKDASYKSELSPFEKEVLDLMNEMLTECENTKKALNKLNQ